MKLKLLVKLVEKILNVTGEEGERGDMYLPERLLAMALVLLAGGTAFGLYGVLKGSVWAAVGGLLGLEPGIAAAVGLVGLFCCATNSPLASIVLSVEMFGGANLYIFAFVCVICFVLSGHSGLYASQIIQFAKADAIKNSEETV